MRGTANLLRLVILIAAASAFAFQAPGPDLAKQAQAALFAARYVDAIELYRTALEKEPDGAECYYGLTRSLLKAHRSKEAYAVAEDALKRLPQTAGAQTAAGLAMFRKGELAKAEQSFRAALKLSKDYSPALSGLASVYSAISQAKTARTLRLQAYAHNPEDPDLMLARANTLTGEKHIAALEEVVSRLDPESEESRGLRAHIAADRALGGKRVRRLVSPYEPAQIKLLQIAHSARSLRGFGLRVRFNDSYTATLMLDTGASGISLSPKSAQKAGLELLSNQSSQAKGIGDQKPQESFRYLASEVRIGDVVFADHPVSVFRAAKDSDMEGLIGADVFQKFVVSLDFPGSQLSLEPYDAAAADEPGDPKVRPGFYRVYRSGDHLMIPTSVNGSPVKLFLIDSGSNSNLIDAEAAGEFTGVHRDDFTSFHGIQGKVDRVSRADRITLVFGGFRQENPNLVAISLEKMSDSIGMGITGVLGMPVIAQLKLTIDYRAGAVKLER